MACLWCSFLQYPYDLFLRQCSDFSLYSATSKERRYFVYQFHSISFHYTIRKRTMPRASPEHNFITALILPNTQYFPSRKNDTRWIKMDNIFEINTTKWVENTNKHSWGNFIFGLSNKQRHPAKTYLFPSFVLTLSVLVQFLRSLINTLIDI